MHIKGYLRCTRKEFFSPSNASSTHENTLNIQKPNANPIVNANGNDNINANAIINANPNLNVMFMTVPVVNGNVNS